MSYCHKYFIIWNIINHNNWLTGTGINYCGHYCRNGKQNNPVGLIAKCWQQKWKLSHVTMDKWQFYRSIYTHPSLSSLNQNVKVALYRAKCPWLLCLINILPNSSNTHTHTHMNTTFNYQKSQSATIQIL